MPPPLPLAPAVIVNHESLLAAVQLHPPGAVTVVDPVPPVEPSDCDVGDNEYEQAVAAWSTVNVCPPIVSVPERVVAFGLAVTLTLTLPLPLPLLPLVTVSQDGALFVVVQLQPPGAVTLVDALALPAATDCDVGDSAYEQVAAA